MTKEKVPDHLPLCPFCERDLKEENRTKDGWNCACGEHIPKGMQVPPRIEQATPCHGRSPKKADDYRE